MATIRSRQRSDGSVAFLAEIRIKRDGALVHRESRTFDRRTVAKAWAQSREKALAKSDGLHNDRPLVARTTLRDILKKYREEVSEVRPMGRSKASHIKFLEKTRIAHIDALQLKSSDLIAHIRARRQAGAGPSTANNDLVWLRVILRYARAAWNLPIDTSVIDNAGEVLKAEKLIAKACRRTRRPTKAELQALSSLFVQKEHRRNGLPMNDIMWFAIHSARRQSEITGLLSNDNDEQSQTGMVRNIKHPTNRDYFRRFKYTPEAWEIVCRQKHGSDRIFPYDGKSIGAAFRRACKMLDIRDLRFHDLRHEATSRLFEAGYSIVEVQQFTLHDSWGTLSRYTHLRPETVKIRAEQRPPGT
jgi:integrase